MSRLDRIARSVAVAATVAALSWSAAAAAEVQEINLARVNGISMLPLMMMERHQLVQKQAKQAGLGDLNVVWWTSGTSNVNNDGLLAGKIDMAANGVPTLLVLWDKTRGTPIEAKALSSISSNPSTLVTRNKMNSLKDFTDKDRIAVAGVGVAAVYVMLQMAAEKEFGPGNSGKLDNLAVSMSLPDGMTAMLSPRSEITAHFASPPYVDREIKAGRFPLLTAKQILGGGGWDLVLCTTKRFHDANPKTSAAVLAALTEAIEMIKKDKRGAAETYIEMSKEKSSVNDILEQINDPDNEFTTAPHTVMAFASFLYRVGKIKGELKTWKDLFFPEAHQLQGS